MVFFDSKGGTYDDNDPIGILDVTVSSNLILRDILGITDLRTDKRIDFVGGIRGLGEPKEASRQWRNENGISIVPSDDGTAYRHSRQW